MKAGGSGIERFGGVLEAEIDERWETLVFDGTSAGAGGLGAGLDGAAGDVVVIEGGGRGGMVEGGGGAAACKVTEDRGIGGAGVEDLRDVTGGGGGFNVPGGRGFARGGVISEGKYFDRESISELGRFAGRSGGLRRFEIKGLDG